jgi:hypothetical protein
MSQHGSYTLERDAFDELFAALARRGYTVVGPKVRDQAIVYDEICCSADLPIGWTDEQDGGHCRLRRRDDEALFGYNVGPHSWKRYQLPPGSASARGAVRTAPLAGSPRRRARLRDMPSSAPGHAIYTPWHPRTRAARRRP